MDLKNLETTSTLAIEAVYREYWRCIPEKYRLIEKAQRKDYKENPEEFNDLEKKKKSSALKIKELDKKKEEPKSDYEKYLDKLNSGKYFDLSPFYEPLNDFENRVHYKIVGVDYLDRREPWFVITWNCGNGLLRSSLTRRRFGSRQDYTPAGDLVSFDFINTDMDLTLSIYSNSMQALFELQENIIISKREKCTVTTSQHSILGKFPVSLDIIDSNIQKLSRDKGTLAVLTLSIKIDFPVIGNVKPVKSGIIKEIHFEIDSVPFEVDLKKPPKDPTAKRVISRDIIKPDETISVFGED